jgi:hypothetical protein
MSCSDMTVDDFLAAFHYGLPLAGVFLDLVIKLIEQIFQVPRLPDTSLCEAQGDGGPGYFLQAAGSTANRARRRREIDMMFAEPPAANLACEIA